MPSSLRGTAAIARRELGAYFSTPLAGVFLTIFVALTGAFAFYVGGFFDRGQADLYAFFAYHPWLYLLLVPAVGMRLWAEERKTGTIELLMTLPVSPWEAVVGKFLAAWAFVGIALLLTLPMWLTVNYLGDPDNGLQAGERGQYLHLSVAGRTRGVLAHGERHLGLARIARSRAGRQPAVGLSRPCLGRRDGEGKRRAILVGESELID